MPEDAATLQLAIEQASPGDTIVLSAGTYGGGNVVPREKRDLTIRGVDRNEVVFDGADRRKNGIVVHADGVSILNVSAHNFLRNGFYWDGANRFRASYVTVWNVREYGVYVEDGEQGVVDNAYVSGAARAAYYVGECRPCQATISNVVARLSAVGLLGHERDRCRDPRFALGPQRRRDRSEHVRERGASAAGAGDDRPQHDHEQRPCTRAHQNRPRRFRRNRDRHRRRKREHGDSQPSNAEVSATASRSFRPRGSSSSLLALPSQGHRGVRGATASRATSSRAAAAQTSPWRKAREHATASWQTEELERCHAASRLRRAPACHLLGTRRSRPSSLGLSR